jgi:hypothetical protein
MGFVGRSTLNKHQLEVELEEKHRELAKANGWLVEKIIRTGRNGFPDRFYAKAGRVVLIEWKRPRRRVGKQQYLRHAELRAAGVEVYVVHSLSEAELVLRMDHSLRRVEDPRTVDL